MATKPQYDAQTVVEEQAEAIRFLMRLKNHRTVQTNPTLTAWVDGAWTHLLNANGVACVVWFPGDTLSDVAEFLPPRDAA